jgi:STE24 endopeptidase
LLVLTLMTLVGLPVGVWAGHRHEQAWGFSTQSLWGWLLDRAKGLGVGLVLGGCALMGLLAATRVWPSAWPVLVGIAAVGLLLVLGFVAPLVLEPLFNRFRPLDDSELAADLRELAVQAGVPIRHVLVSDASRRTRKVNAYVSGLGHTRRVVVYDTLLADSQPRELRLVIAHELGHRRLHHGAKSIALALLGAVAFIAVVWALLDSSALRSAIGVDGAGDPRAIPFLLLVGTVLGLLASPFASGLSRRWERQADAFSLDLTHDSDMYTSTYLRLALTNLADLDPPRLAYLMWASHPTPAERITAVRTREARPPTSSSDAAPLSR